MKSKYILLSFVVLLSGCVTDRDPVAAQDETYETDYGSIEQVNDFPLYKFTYTADYEFDQYLQTGNYPFYDSVSSTDNNFTCTCFAAFGGDNRFLGRNYDWPDQTAYYLVFTDPPNGYASVAMSDMYFFNYHHDLLPDHPDNQNILQILPYRPFDGMNEKGVAVGMNAIPEGQGPYDPAKVTIGELEMIRLILDYAGSTQEAISLIGQYNIRMETPPIHYLIADSSGHSVIIELVDGQMVVMENNNPWQVTTNFIIDGLNNWQDAPCWRYQTAWQTLDNMGGNLSESDAFNLLQNVSVSGTRWSVVFNLKTSQFQIVMGRDFDNPQYFRVF